MVDEKEAVRSIIKLAEDVAGYDKSHISLVVELAEGLTHLADADRIDAIDWFVEKYEVGIVQESECDTEALFHTKREPAELFIFFFGQTNCFDYLVDMSEIGYAFLDSVVFKVLIAGEVTVKGRGFDKVAYAVLDLVEFLAVLAEYSVVALCFFRKTCEYLHHSGLSCAVSADNSVDIPAVYGHIHIVKDCVVLVFFCELFGFQGCFQHFINSCSLIHTNVIIE